MSDINVKYDISYKPRPVEVSLNLKLDSNKVRVSLGDVPPISVNATPSYSADLGSDILSAVGTPMANEIMAILGQFAGGILNGQSFDVFTIPDLNFKIDDTGVALKPSNLGLSVYDGALLITGDLNIG